MTLACIKFPHISHIFPERLFYIIKIFTWILLYSALLLNLGYPLFTSKNKQQLLKDSLLQNPKDPLLHEALGEYYLSINPNLSQSEYLLAEEFYQSQKGNKILGAQTSPWQKWTGFANKKEKLKEEIEKWKKIQNTYPDYLFAALKLATLYYQIGNYEESLNFTKMSLEKSPVDKTALELFDNLLRL